VIPAIHAQVNPNAIAYPTATGAQTETDEYTRYELLAPETASFKIYYEVTATTAGATSFYNPIRKGSEASLFGARLAIGAGWTSALGEMLSLKRPKMSRTGFVIAPRRTITYQNGNDHMLKKLSS
jgi:hypothetical protein